jgi:hypothetical protein
MKKMEEKKTENAEEVKTEVQQHGGYVVVSIAKLIELIKRLPCDNCGGSVKIVSEKGKADTTIAYRCHNNHQNIWNSAKWTKKNNKKKRNLTSWKQVSGGVLSGM